MSQIQKLYKEMAHGPLAAFVGSPTSTRDKTNSQYISGCNPHLTSRFCGVELGLNFTFNMVSKPS